MQILIRKTCDWLNGNKISPNLQKTELVTFKHQSKKIDSKVKIQLSRKWLYHVADITVKLTRGNALLFKIRNFVSVNTLKTIYYTIFDSHNSYAKVVRAQILML